MGKPYVERVQMPEGVAKDRLFGHIQGVAVTPFGYAYSRNGEDNAALIFPGRHHPENKVVPLDMNHAGGIDAEGYVTIIPLYNTADTTGAVVFYVSDSRYYRRALVRRPYAAGIVRDGANYLIALVTEPDGSRIDWYLAPYITSDDWKGQLTHIGITYRPRQTAARNNICLHNVHGDIVLYTMRSYWGDGIVQAHNVSVGQSGVALRDRWDEDIHVPSFLCRSRFGATIDHYGTQGGIQVRLVRTARNIWRDRLRIRVDDVKFEWGT